MNIRRYKVGQCIVFNSKSVGEEKVLSNMFNDCQIVYEGKVFNSSEQLFSFLMCEDEELKERILRLDNSFDIKKLMSEYKKRFKIDSMEYDLKGKGVIYLCLRLKCMYCARFRRFLMNSGDVPLVEYCYWLDRTKVDDEMFGTRLDVEKGEYIGYNACGRWMMQVREELRKGLIEVKGD